MESNVPLLLSVAVVPPTGSEAFSLLAGLASDLIQAPIALVHRHHAFAQPTAQP